MSKPSSQPAQAVSPAAALASLIDEYGDLDAKVTLFKPTLNRHEEVRKLIQGNFVASLAGASYTEHGTRFTCIVGPRENERKITDMRKLAKILKDRFFAICSVALKKLDAEGLSDEQLKGLVTQDRTGTRSVKVVPKSA